MRYIEVVGGIGIQRFDCELTDEELHRIGEFTRESVAKWLDSCCGPGDFPIEDFHAVCDDVDIPWATKEGCEHYRRVMEGVAAYSKQMKEAMMDMKTLVVGQDVFMRSGQVGNWAKVVEVTPTGVIVESDPNYGSELIRFDENGTACDSSDICNGSLGKTPKFPARMVGLGNCI